MKKNKSLRKIYLFIYFILTLLIILSVMYIIDFFSLKREAEEESKLLDSIKIDEDNNYQERVNGSDKTNNVVANNTSVQKNIGIKKGKAYTEKMLKVKTLQQENSDIVGWIEISGTSINYPVLQGTDNEYYMTHNYKKQKSKNGSIFLTKDYDWNIPSSNLLIYGHNLQNGTMFQELLKYESEQYYKSHPIIKFTTEKEDAEYEIIAVLKTRVFYKSEQNVFRYYYFVNAETEEQYNEFIKNAKTESIYNIDKTAKYGEQLITLSTCSYHVKDGRFAVIGRKIED